MAYKLLHCIITSYFAYVVMVCFLSNLLSGSIVRQNRSGKTLENPSLYLDVWNMDFAFTVVESDVRFLVRHLAFKEFSQGVINL